MTPNSAFTVERAPCLGLCEHAPAALVGVSPRGPVALESVAGLFDAAGGSAGGEPHSILGGDLRLLTALCGQGRPPTLAEYMAGGGYQGLPQAPALGPP